MSVTTPLLVILMGSVVTHLEASFALATQDTLVMALSAMVCIDGDCVSIVLHSIS